MYTLTPHIPLFTHSLRLEELPSHFQEFVLIWSRHLPREERLQYHNGEFYVVVPFEWLNHVGMSEKEVSDYIAVYNEAVEDDEYNHVYNDVVARFPYKEWVNYECTFEDYLDMLVFMFYLSKHITPELVGPNLVAVFVHD